jgi:GH25 family lysozyme M1 (1,4-beta-N-acetylmuramidase)
MKRLLSLLTVLTVIATVLTSSALAPPSNITLTALEEWDGDVPLRVGVTYVVSKQIQVGGAHIVPVGTSLLVAEGGELVFDRSARISVLGGLGIARGGRIINSGVVTLEDGAVHERLCSSANVFVNTVNGKLIDESGTVDRYLLTSEAVSRTPLVFKRGIDVSFHQGDIDWESVAAAGVEFAMLRIGAGAVTQVSGNQLHDRLDERFNEYISSARANGIDVGVYWFSYARTVAEIEREARFMLALLENVEHEISYPVVLDMEMSVVDYPDWYTDCASDMAEAFLEIVAGAGYYPMLYSFRYWLTDLISPHVLDKYAGWVAHWDAAGTDYPHNHYMWQYTDRGRVSGIPGNRGEVDLNVGYRDFAAFIRANGLNGIKES